MNGPEEKARLLDVEGLSKSFGGITAVRDVSLHVDKGEIVGLIGPNGAGKTTCFNLITGFYRPDRGTVRFDGHDVTNIAPYEIARRGVIRTFQKTNILRSMTVFENVMAGCYLSTRQSLWETFVPTRRERDTRVEAKRHALTLLMQLGLQDRGDTNASLLSCGELRLLEVAVALAARPKLLMLDEPAAGLNSSEAAYFGELLRKLKGSLVQSILIVEHNMSLVMGVSDRVVVMHFGEKLAEGKPADVQRNSDVIEAYLGKGTRQ